MINNGGDGGECRHSGRAPIRRWRKLTHHRTRAAYAAANLPIGLIGPITRCALRIAWAVPACRCQRCLRSAWEIGRIGAALAAAIRPTGRTSRTGLTTWQR